MLFNDQTVNCGEFKNIVDDTFYFTAENSTVFGRDCYFLFAHHVVPPGVLHTDAIH